jgi:ubiquinone/menaquinone biosynthesis C-methylase UbiE
MHSVAPPPKDPLNEPGPWNAIAKGYDEVVFGQVPALYDAAIELLRPEEGDRILDIGAGPGTLAVRLAPRVGHVVAVDFAKGMIDRLHGHIMRSRVSNVEVKQMDGEDLDFEDGSFDAAVSMFGVCLFDDRKRALEQMLRVVVPGGKVLTASWAAPGVNTLLGVGEDALRVALPEVFSERRELPTENAERCASELEEVGFEGVVVQAFEQSVRFASVAEYWDSFERCSAELALQATRLDAEAYAAATARAREHLLATCGEAHFELVCAALLTCGERPLSAA